MEAASYLQSWRVKLRSIVFISLTRDLRLAQQGSPSAAHPASISQPAFPLDLAIEWLQRFTELALLSIEAACVDEDERHRRVSQGTGLGAVPACSPYAASLRNTLKHSLLLPHQDVTDSSFVCSHFLFLPETAAADTVLQILKAVLPAERTVVSSATAIRWESAGAEGKAAAAAAAAIAGSSSIQDLLLELPAGTALEVGCLKASGTNVESVRAGLLSTVTQYLAQNVSQWLQGQEKQQHSVVTGKGVTAAAGGAVEAEQRNKRQQQENESSDAEEASMSRILADDGLDEAQQGSAASTFSSRPGLFADREASSREISAGSGGAHGTISSRSSSSGSVINKKKYAIWAAWDRKAWDVLLLTLAEVQLVSSYAEEALSTESTEVPSGPHSGFHSGRSGRGGREGAASLFPSAAQEEAESDDSDAVQMQPSQLLPVGERQALMQLRRLMASSSCVLICKPPVKQRHNAGSGGAAGEGAAGAGHPGAFQLEVRGLGRSSVGGSAAAGAMAGAGGRSVSSRAGSVGGRSASAAEDAASRMSGGTGYQQAVLQGGTAPGQQQQQHQGAGVRKSRATAMSTALQRLYNAASGGAGAGSRGGGGGGAVAVAAGGGGGNGMQATIASMPLPSSLQGPAASSSASSSSSAPASFASASSSLGQSAPSLSGWKRPRADSITSTGSACSDKSGVTEESSSSVASGAAAGQRQQQQQQRQQQQLQVHQQSWRGSSPLDAPAAVASSASAAPGINGNSWLSGRLSPYRGAAVLGGLSYSPGLGMSAAANTNALLASLQQQQSAQKRSMRASSVAAGAAASAAAADTSMQMEGDLGGASAFPLPDAAAAAGQEESVHSAPSFAGRMVPATTAAPVPAVPAKGHLPSPLLSAVAAPAVSLPALSSLTDVTGSSIPSEKADHSAFGRQTSAFSPASSSASPVRPAQQAQQYQQHVLQHPASTSIGQSAASAAMAGMPAKGASTAAAAAMGGLGGGVLSFLSSPTTTSGSALSAHFTASAASLGMSRSPAAGLNFLGGSAFLRSSASSNPSSSGGAATSSTTSSGLFVRQSASAGISKAKIAKLQQMQAAQQVQAAQQLQQQQEPQKHASGGEEAPSLSVPVTEIPLPGAESAVPAAPLAAAAGGGEAIPMQPQRLPSLDMFADSIPELDSHHSSSSSSSERRSEAASLQQQGLEEDAAAFSGGGAGAGSNAEDNDDSTMLSSSSASSALQSRAVTPPVALPQQRPSTVLLSGAATLQSGSESMQSATVTSSSVPEGGMQVEETDLAQHRDKQQISLLDSSSKLIPSSARSTPAELTPSTTVAATPSPPEQNGRRSKADADGSVAWDQRQQQRDSHLLRQQEEAAAMQQEEQAQRPRMSVSAHEKQQHSRSSRMSSSNSVSSYGAAQQQQQQQQQQQRNALNTSLDLQLLPSEGHMPELSEAAEALVLSGLGTAVLLVPVGGSSALAVHQQQLLQLRALHSHDALGHHGPPSPGGSISLQHAAALQALSGDPSADKSLLSLCFSKHVQHWQSQQLLLQALEPAPAPSAFKLTVQGFVASFPGQRGTQGLPAGTGKAAGVTCSARLVSTSSLRALSLSSPFRERSAGSPAGSSSLAFDRSSSEGYSMPGLPQSAVLLESLPSAASAERASGSSSLSDLAFLTAWQSAVHKGEKKLHSLLKHSSASTSSSSAHSSSSVSEGLSAQLISFLFNSEVSSSQEGRQQEGEGSLQAGSRGSSSILSSSPSSSSSSSSVRDTAYGAITARALLFLGSLGYVQAVQRPEGAPSTAGQLLASSRTSSMAILQADVDALHCSSSSSSSKSFHTALNLPSPGHSSFSGAAESFRSADVLAQRAALQKERQLLALQRYL